MLKNLLKQNWMHPLRRRLQQDPFYRFQSFEELKLAASWGIFIDANKASIDEWLQLPGLSIHQARRLTRLTTNGIFLSCIEDIAAALGVPSAQARPWEAILQFCYYEANSAIEPATINVNAATAAELTAVPGIDLILARAIVHHRGQGQYQDLVALQQRLRLSAQAAADLLHYLSF